MSLCCWCILHIGLLRLYFVKLFFFSPKNLLFKNAFDKLILRSGRREFISSFRAKNQTGQIVTNSLFCFVLFCFVLFVCLFVCLFFVCLFVFVFDFVFGFDFVFVFVFLIWGGKFSERWVKTNQNKTFCFFSGEAVTGLSCC